MLTEAAIIAKYKELHDLLSESYYNFHNISKKAFDIQHGQIWVDMEAKLVAEGYRPPPESLLPPVFTPLNPTQGVEQRLSHVEAFLESLYPR